MTDVVYNGTNPAKNGGDANDRQLIANAESDLYTCRGSQQFWSSPTVPAHQAAAAHKIHVEYLSIFIRGLLSQLAHSHDRGERETLISDGVHFLLPHFGMKLLSDDLKVWGMCKMSDTGSRTVDPRLGPPLFILSEHSLHFSPVWTICKPGPGIVGGQPQYTRMYPREIIRELTAQFPEQNDSNVVLSWLPS